MICPLCDTEFSGKHLCFLVVTKRRHTITLYRAAGCWMARHSNPIVKEAFGTSNIPTAWTDRADPEKVRCHIAELNPDCEVTIKEESDGNRNDLGQ